MSRTVYTWSVISVLAFAFILRAWTPYPSDILGDDATYAFRSVGYFDHMASQLQTTPYQWFAAPPWWAKLSFHDHPPFSFLLYHAVFRVFGMHTLVLRALPLVCGVVSVWLVILIAGRLAGRRAGLIAGAIAAVVSGQVWISRVALLEGVLMPLLLAALYAGLRAREGRVWALVFGTCAGLAVITKYSALFLVVPMCAWLLVQAVRQGVLKSVRAAFAVMAVMVLPVIVYNVMMLRTRGHPDYQLSRLFHVNSADWREDFSNTRPLQLSHALSTLNDEASLAGSVLFAAACAWLLVQGWKTRRHDYGMLALAVIALYSSAAWMGGDARFIVLLVPFLCITAGAACEDIASRPLMRRWGIAGGVIMLLAMAAYSINTHLLPRPQGIEGRAFARTRMMNFGYEQLDRYLVKLYQERESAGDVWEDGEDETLYIYDSNMNYFPRLWYTQRRVTYQGVPFTSTQEFKKLIQEKGEDYFPSQGFARYVFIHALPGTLLVPENVRDGVSDAMAETLEKQKNDGATITRADGTPAFRIYEF